MSSNLSDERKFLYSKDQNNLIIDFVTNFELFAEQSKLEMRKIIQMLKKLSMKS